MLTFGHQRDEGDHTGPRVALGRWVSNVAACRHGENQECNRQLAVPLGVRADRGGGTKGVELHHVARSPFHPQPRSPAMVEAMSLLILVFTLL